MITRGDIIAFSVIIVLAIVAFFVLRDRKQVSAGPKDSKKGKKEKKASSAGQHDARVSILRKWDMPAELLEISGIAALGGDRFACVQDEQGKIFIFNTATRKIEKQIPFGDKGDYEGIAVVDATAYVLRADGKLFEVKDYNSGKPAVVQHTTHLTAKQDVEGLCYDKKNNRLLLAIKGKEADNSGYKGIYAFDLSSKKLATTPAFKVIADDGGQSGGKGKKNTIQPSDLEIHPSTGDLYIIDGPSAKLLILGPNGQQKSLYALSNADFPQPEGMTFTAAGGLFVSNEGKNGTGNILELAISETGK